MKRKFKKAGFLSGKVITIIMSIVLFCILAGCGGGSDAVPNPTVVTTAKGVVGGFVDTATNTLVWKGIPYAQPPIGDLRWKAPQDALPWQGVKDATTEPTACTQFYSSEDWFGTGSVIGSEDCLKLNVFRPNTNTKLPVYVWIHGGSNAWGFASAYPGMYLASKANMVVVVIQYRLGLLGWFTNPALREGISLNDDSGNFGTLDTLKAVQWVKANIEAFGGDSGNITIAGESAGQHNVSNLLISPLAAGLFHKAILESGGMTNITVAAGEVNSNAAIAALLTQNNISATSWANMSNNDKGDFLRSLPAKDILKSNVISTFFGIVDGHVIPGSFTKTVLSGTYNKVPIILGGNTDEMKPFLPITGELFGIPNWANLASVKYGQGSYNTVLATQDDKDLYQITALYGSRNWRAKFTSEYARSLKGQQNNVFAYNFNWQGIDPDFKLIYGAGHATEINFFHYYPVGMWNSFTPAKDNAGRVALSNAIVQYVANFVRTGDPNGSGLPTWDQWSNTAGGPKTIILDADTTQTLISMSTVEETFTDVANDLNAAVAAKAAISPAFWRAWGWLPYAYQWHAVEPGP